MSIKNIRDFGLGKKFLNKTPKAHHRKTDKLSLALL